MADEISSGYPAEEGLFPMTYPVDGYTRGTQQYCKKSGACRSREEHSPIEPYSKVSPWGDGDLAFSVWNAVLSGSVRPGCTSEAVHWKVC